MGNGMKIIVIDRDSLTNQLLTSRLEAKGHRVSVEANKNTAFNLLRAELFDCIMVDPSPLSEARPVIVGIWKNLHPGLKPYILLLSKTATTEEAVLAGTNDQLRKPLDQQELETKIGNAQRLQDITRWLAHEDNIHSGAGMIGKAAFYQLFLSAMDRAFRYGERCMIIFIALENHVEMRAATEPEEFEEKLTELSKQMTYMRRQSDEIARLSLHDFAVLLQRPQQETEPMNTIDRFSEFLTRFHSNFQGSCPAPRLRLTLVEMPQGQELAERLVPPRIDSVVHI